MRIFTASRAQPSQVCEKISPIHSSRQITDTGTAPMIGKQQFIIIGLGVFGATIARELTRLGHEVLGIDSDEQRVD